MVDLVLVLLFLVVKVGGYDGGFGVGVLGGDAGGYDGGSGVGVGVLGGDVGGYDGGAPGLSAWAGETAWLRFDDGVIRSQRSAVKSLRNLKVSQHPQ